jgi:hypothetical protein
MADAVDHFLNDAVVLYVQAIDYRRIPTNQILAPVESGKLCQNPAMSGYRRRIPTVLCQILARLVKSVQDLARTAGFR